MNPVKMILPFILGMLIASSNELAAVFEVNFGSQSAVYVLEESVIVQFHTCLCTSNSQECKYTKDGTSVESRQMLNTSLLQYSNSFFCYFKLQSELSCERLKNYFLTKECSSLKETPCTVTALSAYGSSCPENMALLKFSGPLNFRIPVVTAELLKLFRCVRLCADNETLQESTTSTTSISTVIRSATATEATYQEIVVAIYVCTTLIVVGLLVCSIVLMIVWKKSVARWLPGRAVCSLHCRPGFSMVRSSCPARSHPTSPCRRFGAGSGVPSPQKRVSFTSILTDRRSQPPVPKEDLIPGNKQRNRLEEIKSNFNGDSARHNASTNQTHSEHEYLELIDYNYPVEEDQRRTQASAQHVDNIDETAISKDNIPEKDTAQNASFSDTIQNNKDQNNSIDVDKINETFVKVFAESDTSLQKTTTA
ncbi:hypothetical protein BgiMline_007513 [Biomphalaria glabrata]